MAIPYPGRLAGFLQTLARILAYRFEHNKARLALSSLSLLEQAVVDQRLKTVKGLSVFSCAARLAGRTRTPRIDAPADGFGRIQRAASGEDAQAGKQAPLGRRQQVIAPVDGGAQRLLAGRQAAQTGVKKFQVVLQPGKHRLGRENVDACGRQFDRQRQAIQASAQLSHGRSVLISDLKIRLDRLSADTEQRYGLRPQQFCGRGSSFRLSAVGQRQRRHRVPRARRSPAAGRGW